MTGHLMSQLENVSKIDYIISHHGEQDHSGAIPRVLEKFPEARILCTSKARPLLVNHLQIAEDAFVVAEDGQSLSLGDKTLEFIHTPWVHWPETMATYLREERILFSCDFFGSHIASSELYVTDRCRVYEAAKRYFTEIMMPFGKTIEKNLEKLAGYDIEMIAPSHGQIYPEPAFIMDAYRQWVTAPPGNKVVLPYVSMHDSTRQMVDHLISALVENGVRVEQFDLAVTDIGKLAMSLVDTATIVVGTPTILAGPHPYAAYCTFLANALRPGAKFLSVVGSYGWGGKTLDTLAGMIPNLNVEVIDPVFCQGAPGKEDLSAMDNLAATIAQKHRENNLS